MQQQLEQSNRNKLEEQESIKEAEAAVAAAKLAEDADLKSAFNIVENDKYEQLTNKEMIDIIAKAVETSMDARSKQSNQILESRVGDLSGQITKTQKAIMQVATTIDVKDTRAEHKDFDEYQKDAAIIMQDTPGISVKDAYLLAKARKVQNVPPKEELDRERPDTSVSRSTVDNSVPNERRTERKESASSRKTGVAGIRDIINAGIDTVQSRRG